MFDPDPAGGFRGIGDPGDMFCSIYWRILARLSVGLGFCVARSVRVVDDGSKFSRPA